MYRPIRRMTLWVPIKHTVLNLLNHEHATGAVSMVSYREVPL